MVREVAYPAGTVLDRHAHDTARFCAVIAGRYREDYVDRRFDCAAGTVTFRPAATLHANRFLEATRCLTIESAVPSCEQVISAHGRAFDIVLQIRREISRADAGSQLILQGLVLQLTGVLERSSAEAEGIPRWLVEVRCRVEANPAAHFSLGIVASEYDIHPSYLATSFRRHFGCTITEFIRQRRIESAAELLRSRDLPLVQVALASGFADQSHFSRTFKRVVGVTPSTFRRNQGQTKS